MVETQFQGLHVEAAITLSTKYLIAGTAVLRGGTLSDMSDDALDIMSPDYRVGIPADLPNITTLPPSTSRAIKSYCLHREFILLFYAVLFYFVLQYLS